jgi:hypothetical protein
VQLFHFLVHAVCYSVGHFLGAAVAVGGGAPLALIAVLKLVQTNQINHTNMLNPWVLTTLSARPSTLDLKMQNKIYQARLKKNSIKN